jgi:hypothetical protein
VNLRSNAIASSSVISNFQYVQLRVGFVMTAVVHDAIRPGLRRAQTLGNVNREAIQAELFGRRIAEVSHDDDAYLIENNRLPAPKFG